MQLLAVVYCKTFSNAVAHMLLYILILREVSQNRDYNANVDTLRTFLHKAGNEAHDSER